VHLHYARDLSNAAATYVDQVVERVLAGDQRARWELAMAVTVAGQIERARERASR
jgi:hypothetical protein